MTISKDVNLGKLFEKMKDDFIPQPFTYNLSKLVLTGQTVLTKNDVAVLIIPDNLIEDFIRIISKSAAYDKFHSECKSDPDDIKDVLPLKEN